MQRFLFLGTDCVKIQETTNASKGFYFTLQFSCFVTLFVFLLLIIADIISLLSVALATAHDRIAALEVKLKDSTEALRDANAAKVSSKKAAEVTEARAKKAKKALAEANKKQSKREQTVVERLDEISTSVGSKYFILSLGILLEFHLLACFACLICTSVM
jgi:hypothetical protein